MLICLSAAKINLALDVLSRRADGYHELHSIVHTVGLWDVLGFEFGSGAGLSLRCNDARLQVEDNLCLQAARAWLAVARDIRPLRLDGLRISLEKNIPAGAGLGGGSGNAAATLLALNRHFDDLLDDAALHRLAATLGADVPLFLRGGCALLEGIGERLTPLPALDGWVVIAQPPLALGTPAVYRKWDELAPASSVIASSASTEALRDAVMARDLQRVAKALHNDLSRAAQECNRAFDRALPALLEALQRCDALGASMTGSGSAVFGIFNNEENARHAFEYLQQAFGSASEQDKLLRLDHVSVAPFCRCGVEFAPAQAMR